MEQFAEEFGQYFDVAESGADFDLEIGSDGITRYVGQEPEFLGITTSQAQENLMKAGEEIAATIPGLIAGMTAGSVGTIGDIAGIVSGIASAISAEEGEGLDAFLATLESVSSTYGSERALKFIRDTADILPISDELKEQINESAEIGSFAGIGGATTAGGKVAAKGVKKLLEPGEPQLPQAPTPMGGAADAETGQFIMTKEGEFISSVGYQSTKPDFQKLLDSKADSQTLETHPHVENTTNEMLARPTNDEVAGDAFETPEWEAAREYTTEAGEKIKGYDGAVKWLLNHARTFAWTDSDMVPPANPVKQDKELIIIVGPPAAGKSTLANPIARQKGAMIVDADEAKKLIPGYDNGVGANVVHEESSAINKHVFNSAIETGGNIVLPVVGGKAESLANKYIGPAKELGYRVTLVDMMVEPEVALQRMYSRFASKDRLIPPEVAKVGTGPTEAFDKLVEQGAADAYTKIDNNPGKREPKIVIRDDDNLIESAGIDARRLEQPAGKSGSKDGPADVQRKGEENSSGSNGSATGRKQ